MIKQISLKGTHLPLKHPFVTALGSKTISRNLAIRVHLNNGMIGYGEASASLAWPQDNPTSMARVLQPLARKLQGRSIQNFESLARKVWADAGKHPTAAAALECALLHAYTLWEGTSLWRWFGGKKSSLHTCLTVSAWEAPLAYRFARQAQRYGFKKLKIKVTGKDLDQDFERVQAVHRAAPRAELWLDGNQGFTASKAIELIAQLQRHKIPVRLFEQPVIKEDWQGLAQVQMSTGVPVVADESARTLDQARKIIRQRTVKVLNIKLAKFGILGALSLIRPARNAGMKLMIGCMAESAQGIFPSVALACGTGAFDFVDLDSHLLVRSPPAPVPFKTQGPRLSVTG